MLDEHAHDRPRFDLRATLNDIQRLQTQRAYRDTRRAFFAEGVRNLVQAIEGRLAARLLIYSDRLLTAPIARKLVRQQRRAGTPTLQVSPETFRRISRTPRASGVAAILEQRWSPLRAVSPGDGLCWIVLQAVRSPGNLGTLIRTSEAVGGAGFILVGPRIDPFDPAVVRASMGALFRQRFVRTGHGELRRWLEGHGCRGVGASPDGSVELHRFGYPRPMILFLGEERRGLGRDERELCAETVRIPMVGAADSLNVAVAGSLLMYEAYRARSLERGIPR